MGESSNVKVAVVGAGFTGLSIAYELAKKGINVSVLEAEAQVGGLASSFDFRGEKLERFYHHWFTNDLDLMHLIDELGLKEFVVINETKTGVYCSNKFFKLSSPWELLTFTPLPFIDRINLAILTFRARMLKNWKELEKITAREWLQEMGGEKLYRIIWEPLLKGKFGSYSDDISAVWIWNKIKLRGASRSKSGKELLFYIKGSFSAVAEALANKICGFGGSISLKEPVKKIRPVSGKWEITTSKGIVYAEHVAVTVAPLLIANMIEKWASNSYVNALKRIKYLANVCLVLELNQPLSDIYWLNVCDPTFPFVGVIEHTNFQTSEYYGGRHIVYLSKYLAHNDSIYMMDKDELLDYAYPFLKQMFPKLNRSWIIRHYLWKARWAQPVVEKNYGEIMLPLSPNKDGLYLCTMAQIYPEDRGTNYAIREGKYMASLIAKNV